MTRAQAPRPHDLAQDPPADLRADGVELRVFHPPGQALGRAFQRRHAARHGRLEADQLGHRPAGRQPGHCRQPAAEVEIGTQEVDHAGAGFQDLRQRLFQHSERQGPQRRRLRGVVGEVEQAGDLAAPALGRLQPHGHRAAKQVGAVRFGGDPLDRPGETLGFEIGEGAAARVLQHP